METNGTLVTKDNLSFFAAANSFDGFKSYFDICFDPREYERIYILKGGPGTGKSTLMKRIAALGESGGIYTERIYCSSDINSLDGVILQYNQKKIAMLDGTAPHIVDATLPGACEVIVNLGNFFNNGALAKNRSEIARLNDDKNKWYAKAYNELSLSSVFERNIKAECAKHFDYDKAKETANLLCQLINHDGEGRCTTRLISAFGKDGYKRFTTLDSVCQRIYSLVGRYGTAEIMAQIILAKMKKTKTDIYIFPYCLDTSSTEAIYIPALKTCVIVNATSGTKIDCEEFLTTDFADEMTIGSYEIFENLLLRSQKCFALASESHFALEKIYSPLVDFSGVEEKSQEILMEIKNILSLDI